MTLFTHIEKYPTCSQWKEKEYAASLLPFDELSNALVVQLERPNFPIGFMMRLKVRPGEKVSRVSLCTTVPHSHPLIHTHVHLHALQGHERAQVFFRCGVAIAAFLFLSRQSSLSKSPRTIFRRAPAERHVIFFFSLFSSDRQVIAQQSSLVANRIAWHTASITAASHLERSSNSREIIARVLSPAQRLLRRCHRRGRPSRRRRRSRRGETRNA